MQRTRPYNFSFLMLLACFLVLTGTAFCSSDPSPGPAEEAAPVKPNLTPTGPQLVLQPGMVQTLRANSPGATRFKWALQGEGKLSSGDGDSVLYTAPDHGGAMALVTVVAHNQRGASPQSSITISTTTQPTVSLATIAIPAGWMTEEGRNPSTVIDLSAGTGCHTGADCIRIHYKGDATWAGIIWWPKACGSKGTPNSWPKATSCSCTVDVLKAGNLRAVNRVSFWARGERGGEVVEFKVGEDTICPSPGRSSDPLTLTGEWQRHTIDLNNLDMRRAVALFTWVATDLHNPKGATFYLDDVQFEGTR
jgi:hypothetical protein